MRKRSRQIYSFPYPDCDDGLMIAEMQWEHIHIRQLFDALFLFSFLFLWETSLSNGSNGDKYAERFNIQSMDRVAFILGRLQ